MLPVPHIWSAQCIKTTHFRGHLQIFGWQIMMHCLAAASWRPHDLFRTFLFDFPEKREKRPCDWNARLGKRRLLRSADNYSYIIIHSLFIVTRTIPVLPSSDLIHFGTWSAKRGRVLSNSIYFYHASWIYYTSRAREARFKFHLEPHLVHDSNREDRIVADGRFSSNLLARLSGCPGPINSRG